MTEIQDGPDALDSGRIWRLIRENRWIVLGVALAVTVLSGAAAFLSTPVYRARVVLVPAESSDLSGGLGSMVGDLGGIASLAGLNLGGGAATTEAIELMKSRQFAEDFIRSGNLMPRLFRKQWDADRKAWKGPANKTPTPWEAWQYFDRNVRHVSEDKNTGVVTLEMDWIDPKEAADWANRFASRVNESMRARTVDEANASILELQKELRSTDVVALQQAIYRLIETHIKRRTVALVRPEFAFRVVDPAAAPDPDDFVRPNRVLYLLAGPVLGLMLAVFCLMVRDFVRRQSRSHEDAARAA